MKEPVLEAEPVRGVEMTQCLVLRVLRGKGVAPDDPVREVVQFWLALPSGSYRLLAEEDPARA